MLRRAPLLLIATAVLAAAPAAWAADPHRWVQTAVTKTKPEYFQGITSDGRGHLFFDGFQVGGYRTDLRLREQARNEDMIPADVAAAEGFNHIGDWTFSAGRLVLPLECYHPELGGDPNTCGRGAFGIVNPATMQWAYRLRLDPADIPKAMWAEASPNGRLLWTSAGNDLLAYRTRDLAPRGDAVIRPVRRLSNAVPPSGITGAAFYGGRLFVAGQDTGRFQVWSIDTRTGGRRLEIERRWAGESEGLAVVAALGGALQWQVQPFDPRQRTPTFGPGHGTIVSFVPRAAARIRVRVRPRVLRAGRRTAVRVTTTLRYLGADHRVRGVRVRAGRVGATTSSSGRATLHVRARRPGLLVVRARNAPLRQGTAMLTVAPLRGACSAATPRC